MPRPSHAPARSPPCSYQPFSRVIHWAVRCVLSRPSPTEGSGSASSSLMFSRFSTARVLVPLISSLTHSPPDISAKKLHLCLPNHYCSCESFFQLARNTNQKVMVGHGSSHRRATPRRTTSHRDATPRHATPRRTMPHHATPRNSLLFASALATASLKLIASPSLTLPPPTTTTTTTNHHASSAST